MKFKYNESLIVVLGCLVIWCMMSCQKQNEPEPINLQQPEKGTDAYYENLRAYKKSDHAVAFGWFGFWTAKGASKSHYLTGLPDSVDIVSLWGPGFPFSNEKKKDLNYVQKVKGTRVLLCFIVSNVGDGIGGRDLFPGSSEDAIKSYASAIVDTIQKYGLDGFDIDYEPDYGSPGNLSASSGPVQDSMAIFVRELGKSLGPQSGTDKLLLIDGQPDALKAELGKYFNYYVSQAYATSSPGNLQSRMNNMTYLETFNSRKFIVAENFESYWQDGGVNYSDPTHGIVPSLIGMAYWNPQQGRKGGVGTYHMEYDYRNNPDYKYLREAIQIMNPAPY